MAAIDIGPGATDRGDELGAAYTTLDKANPANDSGIITSIEVWAKTNLTGLKIGTFFGSGTSWTSRGYATLGNVQAGSKATFIAPTNFAAFAVAVGDIIGEYRASGNLELDTSGGAGILYSAAGDMFDGVAHNYTLNANMAISIYGAGVTVKVRSFGLIIG